MSGGSIAAASVLSAVADHGPHALTDFGFCSTVFDPFVSTVTSSNLRNRALARWTVGRLLPG